MSKKKQKSIPQRNIVAKFARDFNMSSSEVSKKDKQKHRAPKHRHEEQ